MRLFVPGRVCLFGEHSDWAGGYRRVNSALEVGRAIITGTDQGIEAAVAAHPASLIVSAVTPDGNLQGPREIPMQAEALLAEAQSGGFFSYMAGAAYQVQRRGPTAGLIIENDRTDLPVKKGLSSSAAISVLTVRAFNRIYRLGLTTREEMEIAYEGEITTPSRCGRMDQGCAFGNRPILMTFDGDQVETEPVRVGSDFHLVLVDLRGMKDTVTILADLNRSFPFAGSELDRGVQHLLGPVNRALVGSAAEALTAGDGARLGSLMTEAQAAFDRWAVPASPDELAAPRLHRVLQYPKLQEWIWGGKGVGSQGDGSAQLLARGPSEQEAAIAVIERELEMPCLRLTLRRSEPAPGPLSS